MCRCGALLAAALRRWGVRTPEKGRRVGGRQTRATSSSFFLFSMMKKKKIYTYMHVVVRRQSVFPVDAERKTRLLRCTDTRNAQKTPLCAACFLSFNPSERGFSRKPSKHKSASSSAVYVHRSSKQSAPPPPPSFFAVSLSIPTMTPTPDLRRSFHFLRKKTKRAGISSSRQNKSRRLSLALSLSDAVSLFLSAFELP